MILKNYKKNSNELFRKKYFNVEQLFVNMNIERTILRIGLGLVILWFGVEQILNPNSWIGYVPLWLDSLLTATVVVYINGGFEIIASLLLIFNRFVKLSSLLLSIHLVLIIIELGYNATAIRDIGILVGLIALFAMERNKKLLLYN